MFFKYPYTDMYNLNLDWMLQAIREVQEIITALGSVVNTVNGESGDVVISDEMINAAGVGVLQTYSAPTTIDDLTPTQLLSLYDNGKRIIIFRNNLNVFDRVYFLQKNGSTVTTVYYDPGSFMAGVRSINGSSGDILLNAANLPVNNLPDAPTTGTVITGVQQDIGDTAALETTAHVLVTAINELLAALNTEETARADGDDAVFAEMAETVALLLTVDDSDIAEETISVGQYVYFDGILYQCIAGITSGETAITDLTLSTYLTQIPAGGLNDLNADLRTLIGDEATARTNADNELNSQIGNLGNQFITSSVTINIGTYQLGNYPPRIVKYGKVCVLQLYGMENLQGNIDNIVGTIPSGYIPEIEVMHMCVGSSGDIINVYLDTYGSLHVYPYGTFTSINTRSSFAYISA